MQPPQGQIAFKYGMRMLTLVKQGAKKNVHLKPVEEKMIDNKDLSKKKSLSRSI